MHVLIVHDDAEVGEQLTGMVQDYTSHRCVLAESDTAAFRWADRHAECQLLITQLDGSRVDGLALGGPLGEMFPGLHTIFLPTYPAADRRIEIPQTKVFPEPIDGEKLLEAIELIAAKAGMPDLFCVLDLLQMCCLSRKTGAVQFVRDGTSGIVYLAKGEIVHAETENASGLDALGEIADWGTVEFAFDSSVRGPSTIAAPWHDCLSEPGAGSLHGEWTGKKQTDPAEFAGSKQTSERTKPGFFGALRSF